MLKKAKIIYAVLCAVFACIGLIMLIEPKASVQWLSIMSGIILLAAGIACVLDYLISPVRGALKTVVFIIGIAALIAGVFFICHPGWLLSAVPVAIGIFLLAEGLSDLRFTVATARKGSKKWWLILIAAVLTAVLGIVFIANARSVGTLIIRICGLAFVAAALIRLIGTLYISVKEKKSESGYIEYEDAGSKEEHYTE